MRVADFKGQIYRGCWLLLYDLAGPSCNIATRVVVAMGLWRWLQMSKQCWIEPRVLYYLSVIYPVCSKIRLPLDPQTPSEYIAKELDPQVHCPYSDQLYGSSAGCIVCPWNIHTMLLYFVLLWICYPFHARQINSCRFVKPKLEGNDLIINDLQGAPGVVNYCVVLWIHEAVRLTN